MYREIAGNCRKVAAQKGLTVVEPGLPGCLPINLDWAVSGGREYTGTATDCYAFSNSSATCTSRPTYASSYRKTIRLDVLDATGAQQVHQIYAVLVSKFPEFRSEAAIALCRAAFEDYPARIDGAMYDAATDL